VSKFLICLRRAWTPFNDLLTVEKKILIVEDQADLREMLATLLRAEGFMIYTASDGREGLEVFKTNCPDLIVTDINMPNMNGVDMVRTVREMHCDSIPILVLTAVGSGVASDALEAGANQALIKPVELQTLVNGVKRLLNS
jgi:two-component system chemotaxis response regulator CheY